MWDPLRVAVKEDTCGGLGGEGVIQLKLDQLYLKALEGFFIIIASEGDIMFLSENVAKYLGLTQVRGNGVLLRHAHCCNLWIPQPHTQSTSASLRWEAKVYCSGTHTTVISEYLHLTRKVPRPHSGERLQSTSASRIPPRPRTVEWHYFGIMDVTLSKVSSVTLRTVLTTDTANMTLLWHHTC